jgi:glutathione-specific gamma-glutamylcyclotransferase
MRRFDDGGWRVNPHIGKSPAMKLAIDQIPEDLWVFGYGSLLWRPGFPFIERVPARMTGLHRSLCVYSFVHRGTPEKPGLVLGLDRGGACRGLAFRVAAPDRATTIEYLREREQATSVYLEVLRNVTLLGHPQQRVEALTYIVDRGHRQYAGKLTLEQRLHLIRQGHGRSGPNPEYVLSTVAELESLGCRDAELHALAVRLKGSHATEAPPGSDPAPVR